jgi:acetate kinase
LDLAALASVRVLAINAGSSSLKASLVEEGVSLKATTLGWDEAVRGETVARAITDLGLGGGRVDAVAHRIVHGGERLISPVIVDDAVVAEIEAIGELAPLHNDVALETMESARSLIGDRPHVACFDTAFHATLPEVALRYPVPASWWTRWGIRRFGFHGLSVEWAVGRAAELLRREPVQLGLVVAHLGSGCSVTAVARGDSIWTSMGFTPLDGLMMRTRSGAIDPGILLHLLRTDRLDLEHLASALEHQSGLAGVGGADGDVRRLQAAADSGDRNALLALDMFASCASAGIAGAATWLPRLDGIVFTGGIGEHAGRLRARIVMGLRVLGVEPVDDTETGNDRVLGGGAVPTLRIEAREDLVLARAATRLTETGAG